MFPVDHFRWHAAYSLSCSARGRMIEAREHAERALAAGINDNSGFRYHAAAGLVGSKYHDLQEELARLCHA